MFAHQSQEQRLIHLIIRTPIVTYYVVSYSLNELGMKIIMGSSFLNRRVRKCAQTFCVVNIKMNVVSSNAINSDQINNSLLPCMGSRILEVFDTSNIIIFNFMKCTFVRYVSLTMHVVHWIHLNKNQVRAYRHDSFLNNVDCWFQWKLGKTKKISFSIWVIRFNMPCECCFWKWLAFHRSRVIKNVFLWSHGGVGSTWKRFKVSSDR